MRTVSVGIGPGGAANIGTSGRERRNTGGKMRKFGRNIAKLLRGSRFQIEGIRGRVLTYEDHRTTLGKLLSRDGGELWGRYLEETGRLAAIRSIVTMIMGDLKQGEIILDVATTTGVVTELILQRQGTGVRVIANDLSPHLAAIAGKRLKGYEELVAITTEDPTGWMDGPIKKVDVVIWNGEIHVARDRTGVLAGIMRRLNPDGRLYIIDEKPAMLPDARYGGDLRAYTKELSRPSDMGVALSRCVNQACSMAYLADSEGTVTPNRIAPVQHTIRIIGLPPSIHAQMVSVRFVKPQ